MSSRLEGVLSMCDFGVVTSSVVRCECRRGVFCVTGGGAGKGERRRIRGDVRGRDLGGGN